MAKKKKDEAVIEAAETAEAAPAASMVYVGATVPGMRSGTVFIGEAPEVIRSEPFAQCVIPLTELTAWTRRKAVTSSKQAQLYRHTAKAAAELYARM